MNKDILNTFRTQMGEKAFWRYVNKVYRKTMLMHSNESFSITEICETTTEPLFREILTAIINMHPGEYLFSDDYSRFKKTDTDGLAAARKIRENAYRKNDNEGDGETSSSTRVRPQTLHPSGADLPNKKSIPQSGIRSSKTQVRAS